MSDEVNIVKFTTPYAEHALYVAGTSGNVR
jgi:hypothetical protein